MHSNKQAKCKTQPTEVKQNQNKAKQTDDHQTTHKVKGNPNPNNNQTNNPKNKAPNS